jgi:hypothetical protein
MERLLQERALEVGGRHPASVAIGFRYGSMAGEWARR